MALQAIIFGSIGTLTETSHMQRASFNAAFAEAGLDWHWNADEYARMVADGASGGKARIAGYAAGRGMAMADSMAQALHDRKSALFQAMMADEGLVPNPGVAELLVEARAAGLGLAMASTTSARNIAAMFAATRPVLTADMFDVVTSDAVVARGKPAPDVYLAVLESLGIRAETAVAIEDTLQSLAAPVAAGIVTLAVPGAIARNQDFGTVPTARSVADFGGLAALRALLADTAVPAQA